MKKKLIAVLAALALVFPLFAADIFVTTPGGEKVVLHDDLTWEYVRGKGWIGGEYQMDIVDMVALMLDPSSDFYQSELAEIYDFLAEITGGTEVLADALEEIIREAGAVTDITLSFGEAELMIDVEGDAEAAAYEFRGNVIYSEGEMIGYFNDDCSMFYLGGIVPIRRIN